MAETTRTTQVNPLSTITPCATGYDMGYKTQVLIDISPLENTVYTTAQEVVAIKGMYNPGFFGNNFGL